MFLGDELTNVLESIETDSDYTDQVKCNMEMGVHVLPNFQKDTTDRNRTSPFAFTGNKFEFRMLGSSSRSPALTSSSIPSLRKNSGNLRMNSKRAAVLLKTY